MGKLTNIRIDDARLPIFRFVLSQNGINNSIYSKSTRELTVNEMSNSALQNMWAGIDAETELKYSNMKRYRLLNIRLPSEISDITLAKKSGTSMVIVGSDVARKTVIEMAGYSETDALGWADKAAIAERVLSGTASDEENTQLEMEATYRGLSETKEQLATQQIEHAVSFRQKRSIIDGSVRRAKDQISAATTVTSIKDIVNRFAEDLATNLVSAE